MKIAVITAVFGDMDTPKPFATQSVECARIFVTEENSPFPLPNLPPRLQAKYFKLQAHRAFPEYDAYVWIDGNIEVTSPDFVKVMTEDLEGIRIQRHYERKTIREEIEFILASNNQYLRTRYGEQPLLREYEFYLNAEMPDSSSLYSCNIFSYPAHKRNLLDWWWDMVLQWSWFDQSAFSYLNWMTACAKPVELGPIFNNPYYILHPHTNWNQ